MIAPIEPRDTKKPDPALIPKPLSARGNRFVWVFSSIVVFMAGSAFLFKLVDFLYTFGKPAVITSTDPSADVTLPFAIQPVVTYLIVATGYSCLFIWAYMSGQFKDIEAPKYRMIQMQDEVDDAEARAGN
jgi:hypothetical protein